MNGKPANGNPKVTPLNGWYEPKIVDALFENGVDVKAKDKNKKHSPTSGCVQISFQRCEIIAEEGLL